MALQDKHWSLGLLIFSLSLRVPSLSGMESVLNRADHLQGLLRRLDDCFDDPAQMVETCNNKQQQTFLPVASENGNAKRRAA